MELLRSIHYQARNNCRLIQDCMAKIHNALLACLSDTAAISGVEDYHPGIIELYEQFAFTPFSTVLPLGISRNGVDVFNGRTDIIPYLKIIKKTGGGYVLIDGFHQYISGKNRHMSYCELPAVMMKFAEQMFRSGDRKANISFSRIS